MATGATLMGRSTSGRKGTKAVKGSREAQKKTKQIPASPEAERETIVNMKGSADYAGWLEAVHRKTHIPKAQIVRLALATWAMANGHDAPPEI